MSPAAQRQNCLQYRVWDSTGLSLEVCVSGYAEPLHIDKSREGASLNLAELNNGGLLNSRFRPCRFRFCYLHLQTQKRRASSEAGMAKKMLAAQSASGVAFALGLLFGLSGPAHATDGYFAHGTGVKAKGQAGAGVADPQDAISIAANPAGAISLGKRWDAGVELFLPSRSATIRGNGAGASGAYDGDGRKVFLIPEFGYVRPLNDRVSLGIALYGNGGLNTDYKVNPFRAFGGAGKAGVNFEQLFISTTLAVRIAEGQSVGVSVNAVVQRFEAKGLNAFASSSASPINFTNRGVDTAYGVGFRLGWLGRFNDRFSAGAFYQPRTSVGEFDKYAGLFAEKGGFDVPASYGAGISYKATDKLTVDADVRQIKYSEVPSVGNDLSQLFLGNPFGSSRGPGFGWNDTTSYKLGASYAISPSFTVRGGYGYNTQPIPSSQTFLNILAPGVVQSQYTAGATWKLASGIEISGYALYAPKKTVNGAGSIPVPFGAGEANVSLRETAFGLAIGRAF